MWLLHEIAERRITEAIARGELRDLPGQGKSLDLDDDVLVPEEWRLAHRILRNAGFVPEQVTLRRELEILEIRMEEGRGCGQPMSDDEYAHAVRRLSLLHTRLEAASPGRGALGLGSYGGKALRRLARGL